MKNIKEYISEAYADSYLGKDTCDNIVDALKNALKEEFNAWYGYIIVRDWLVGSCRPEVVKMYDEIAEDELKDHGYWLMKRINELGGTIEDISNSPASWLQAVHGYIAPKWSNKTPEDSMNDEKVLSIQDSLMTNINNEIGAIETYQHLVELSEECKDWTTNSKCKEILADEEEHLQMLQDFLDDYIEKHKEL